MMKPNRSVQLDGVQQTLLIPLWARAKEIQKKNPILIDRRAAGILKDAGFDSTRLDENINEYYQLTWTVRAKMLDEEIRTFLFRCPKSTIVNIGAGLDTTFERVDNGQVEWYDLDLPDVIELRTRLIPRTARTHYIAQSALGSGWFAEIGKPRDGVLLAACGVLPYFRAKEARQLFGNLATRFPGSEIVFDTASRFFVWAGKWLLRWQTGISTQSFMKWGVTSAREIAQWDPRIQVVEEYPFFSKIRMDPSWGKDTVHAMKRADRMHGFNIFHLKFEDGLRLERSTGE